MTLMAKVVETKGAESSSEEEVEDSDIESEDVAPDDESQETSNAAWADSIAKILRTNKPKGKKSLVLSKAKKLTDLKKTKTTTAGFQIATADGEIKEEKIEVEDKTIEEAQPRKRRKKELPEFRVKPNILEKDRERTLTKIATRGVVQLFNAVRMQQKDIDKKLVEAGPLEVRKEKVLKSIDKRDFLNVLMDRKTHSEGEKDVSTEKKREESTWSVLRDDFMMGAKLKDWDKEGEDEEEKEMEVDMESD